MKTTTIKVKTISERVQVGGSYYRGNQSMTFGYEEHIQKGYFAYSYSSFLQNIERMKEKHIVFIPKLKVKGLIMTSSRNRDDLNLNTHKNGIIFYKGKYWMADSITEDRDKQKDLEGGVGLWGGAGKWEKTYEIVMHPIYLERLHCMPKSFGKILKSGDLELHKTEDGDYILKK